MPGEAKMLREVGPYVLGNEVGRPLAEIVLAPRWGKSPYPLRAVQSHAASPPGHPSVGRWRHRTLKTRLAIAFGGGRCMLSVGPESIMEIPD